MVPLPTLTSVSSCIFCSACVILSEIIAIRLKCISSVAYLLILCSIVGFATDNQSATRKQNTCI